jgi:hypothetical protein
MSDMAKKARAAMKAKAQRLGKDRPLERVDSADWTPPEMLNADVKTGMRPLSRRAFKKGGKVVGDCNAPRADRKPRKAGGKVEERGEAKAFANAKVNRNVKDANELREGKKHIGGLKTGGRAKKEIGGAMSMFSPALMAINALRGDKDEKKRGGRAKRNTGGGTFTKGGKDYEMTPNGPRPLENKPAAPAPKHPPVPPPSNRAPEKGMTGEEATKFMEGRKKGGKVDKKTGRTKKMMGGPMMNPGQVLGSLTPAAMGGGNNPSGGAAGATPTQPDPRMFMVSPKSMEFGQNTVTPGLKKGGKVKHPDEAMDRALFKKMEKAEGKKERREDEKADKALIKKMVKPSARTGKADGGEMMMGAGTGKRTDKPQNVYQPEYNEEAVDKAIKGSRQKIGGKEGAMIKSLLKGRTGRATGGRTKAKGKTNINIVIAAGKPQAPGMGPMDMPPPPMGGPGAAAVPVPPAKPTGPQAAPMPMPVPMPMPMPGGAPGGGMPPIPRKSGGRITKVAKSYKDMEAGAGSGEGRLQKTDIAKRIPKPGFQKGDNVYSGVGYPNKVPGATGGRTARKAGGGVYRSYKDMDAGAGSGLGRMEKTEIASRKN